jgi:hypothetical protein
MNSKCQACQPTLAGHGHDTSPVMRRWCLDPLLGLVCVELHGAPWGLAELVT